MHDHQFRMARDFGEFPSKSCEILAGLKQRAALPHIAGDILEIGLRQDAAPAVAVEDDEVELVDLDVEQLADREGDQRQLADRRAVLLFRRTQDREMHQLDRGVGFQDVAPHPLAGMRLARNQEHPQPVADIRGQLELLGLNGALKLRPELPNLRLPLQFVPPRRLVPPSGMPSTPVDTSQQVAKRCLKRRVTPRTPQPPGRAKVAERSGAEIAASLIASDANQRRLLMKLLQQLPNLRRRRGFRRLFFRGFQKFVLRVYRSRPAPR